MVLQESWLRALWCLLVFLGAAMLLTSSASVNQSVLQSIVVDPGRAAPTAVVSEVPFSPVEPRPAAPKKLSELTEAEELMTAASSPAMSRYVVKSGVNVRALPSNGGTRVGTLERGEFVAVISRDGHWAKVARDAMVLGWVYDRFLAPAQTEVASSEE